MHACAPCVPVSTQICKRVYTPASTCTSVLSTGTLVSVYCSFSFCIHGYILLGAHRLELSRIFSKHLGYLESHRQMNNSRKAPQHRELLTCVLRLLGESYGVLQRWHPRDGGGWSTEYMLLSTTSLLQKVCPSEQPSLQGSQALSSQGYQSHQSLSFQEKNGGCIEMMAARGAPTFLAINPCLPSPCLYHC